RLRDQLHVLAGPAAPYRAGPGAARPGQGRPAGPARIHGRPPLREGRCARGAAPVLQSRAEDGGSSEPYDAIVIGGGHNGLVNGAYLARGGRRTLILAQRGMGGGGGV